MKTVTKTYYETSEFGDFQTGRVIEHIYEDSRVADLELELASTKKMLDEALDILGSFEEYRSASDNKETSKTTWHTFERILYDKARSFLAKHEKKEGV